MSNTAASVLEVAKSQMGTTGGKKYWDYVMGGGYVNGSVTPYCACGVSWVFHKAGARCAGLPSASCTYGIYAGAKKAGKVVPVSQARAGDVILFDFDSHHGDSEHVGIIRDVGASTFVCYEFNTSSAGSTTGGHQMVKVRNKKYTFAIVRPDYEQKPATADLVVDGWAGPLTVRRWQEVVGSAYLDGVISGQWEHNSVYFPNLVSVTFEDTGESQLVKICQHKMGIAADGYIGPKFVEALQKRLGVEEWATVKGRRVRVIGTNTVKALQKTLNMRRF